MPPERVLTHPVSSSRALRLRPALILLLAGLVCGLACAPRTTTPVVAPTPRFPEYVFPQAPAALGNTPSSGRVTEGWQLLQGGQIARARRAFAEASRREPSYFPAMAGAAYAALAAGEAMASVDLFGRVLSVAPDYGPALVGRGLARLGAGEDAGALADFERALAVRPDVAGLATRVEVLRLRRLQVLVERAREAVADGRIDDAAATYLAAIDTSPESAFLHRELGLLERARGASAPAMAALRRATDLDAADTVSLVALGELLETEGDLAGAEDAYRRAAAIDPSGDVLQHIERLALVARDAALPAPFRQIPADPRISRGALAALIGVRLDGVLAAAPSTPVVMTDTAGHWASRWITRVAGSGVLPPFDNHTFQPAAEVRRGDLAAAVSRLVRLAAVRQPSLQSALGARPAVADMSAAHLAYPAVAVAVASGVMPLLEGGRFAPLAPVPGQEAVEVVSRLQALVSSR